MRASSFAIGIGSALAAAVTGFATYSAVEAGPGADASAAAQPSAPVAAEPRVRFRPCEPPARLERRTCVTRVVRTVVAGESSPAQLTSPVGRQSPGDAVSTTASSDDEDRDDRDDTRGTGTHTGTHTGTDTGTQHDPDDSSGHGGDDDDHDDDDRDEDRDDDHSGHGGGGDDDDNDD